MMMMRFNNSSSSNASVSSNKSKKGNSTSKLADFPSLLFLRGKAAQVRDHCSEADESESAWSESTTTGVSSSFPEFLFMKIPSDDQPTTPFSSSSSASSSSKKKKKSKSSKSKSKSKSKTKGALESIGTTATTTISSSITSLLMMNQQEEEAAQVDFANTNGSKRNSFLTVLEKLMSSDNGKELIAKHAQGVQITDVSKSSKKKDKKKKKKSHHKRGHPKTIEIDLSLEEDNRRRISDLADPLPQLTSSCCGRRMSTSERSSAVLTVTTTTMDESRSDFFDWKRHSETQQQQQMQL